MCFRTCTGKGPGKRFREEFNTKHMFHVAYLKPLLRKTVIGIHAKQFQVDITELVKSFFKTFDQDEIKGVKNSLQAGNAFVLFALNSNGTKRLVFGVILFSFDKHAFGSIGLLCLTNILILLPMGEKQLENLSATVGLELF